MPTILSINYQTEYASDQLPSNAVALAGGPISPSYRPTLTQEGMTFEGWYTSNTYETLVDDNYIVPADATSLTLYAKWSIISVKTKMTAIADEIRVLSGTTGAMGLDAMASNVGEANGKVTTQVDLIEQIQTALEGKTAVGGGSGEAVIETCTVTVNITNASGAATKFFTEEGIIGISYINETGMLNITENPSGMKSSWSTSVVCRCSTTLSVSLGIFARIDSVSVNNAEIQYTMSTYSGRSMVTCMLPDSTGTYIINVYHG